MERKTVERGVTVDLNDDKNILPITLKEGQRIVVTKDTTYVPYPGCGTRVVTTIRIEDIPADKFNVTPKKDKK